MAVSDGLRFRGQVPDSKDPGLQSKLAIIATTTATNTASNGTSGKQITHNDSNSTPEDQNILTDIKSNCKKNQKNNALLCSRGAPSKYDEGYVSGDDKQAKADATTSPLDTQTPKVDNNNNNNNNDSPQKLETTQTKDDKLKAEQKKTEQDKEALSVENVLIVMKILPQIISLVWDTRPFLLLMLMFMNIINGLLPSFEAVTTSSLVDSIQKAVMSGTTDTSDIIYWTCLQVAFKLVEELIWSMQYVVESLLNTAVNAHLDVKILTKASTLDLNHFEQSETAAIIREAQSSSWYTPVATIRVIFSAVESFITFISMCIVLTNNPKCIYLVPIALFHPILSFIVNLRMISHTWKRTKSERTPRQMMWYLKSMMTSVESQKEIRLYDLGAHFVNMYKNISTQFSDADQRDQVRNQIIWSALSLLSNLDRSIIYYQVAIQAISNTISLGDLTLYTTATSRFASSFSGVLSEVNQVYKSSLQLKDLYDFFSLEPRITSNPNAALYHEVESNYEANLEKKGLKVRKGMKIEFRKVSFKYEGKNDYCLKDISFTIHSGEVIALVGANGAGKTTLIKLIMRLYEPTSGDIFVNDQNIKDINLSDLREHAAAVFQDFARYTMTIRENIALGNQKEANNMEAIQEAAVRSGAHEFIEKLPEKYETLLGKLWGEDGLDLSGGEWQKIALARAFMRERTTRLLIADEPTSALDARAEHEIFQTIRKLANDKTTLFISHRFSTVRNADRILLVEQGTVRESGTHDELLSLGGRYAELFNLQAEAYK